MRYVLIYFVIIVQLYRAIYRNWISYIDLNVRVAQNLRAVAYSHSFTCIFRQRNKLKFYQCDSLDRVIKYKNGETLLGHQEIRYK